MSAVSQLRSSKLSAPRPTAQGAQAAKSGPVRPEFARQPSDGVQLSAESREGSEGSPAVLGALQSWGGQSETVENTAPAGGTSPGDTADVVAAHSPVTSTLRGLQNAGSVLGGIAGIGNLAEATLRAGQGDTAGALVSAGEATGDAATVASRGFAPTSLAGGVLRGVAPAAGALEGVHQIATAEEPSDRLSGGLKIASAGLLIAASWPAALAAGAVYGTSLALDHTNLGEAYNEHGFGTATWEEMSVAP